MSNPQRTKILLLGSSGYVGKAFQLHLNRLQLEWQPLSLKDPSLSKRAVLQNAIRSYRPGFLINCAGYTGKPNVDTAETEKHACLEANTWLPGLIAEVCQDLGQPWGHVSSGCIYTGRKPDGSGFRESDPPNFDFRHNNCSFYSGTKALAEEILASYHQVYLWRMRIPFNEVDSPRNYLSKLMRYGRLLDVENSISNLDEFVQACLACWDKRIPFGTYNLTNPGFVTTREVAAMIQQAGLVNREWKFFQDEAEFMAQAAKTPRSSCVLDSSKILSCGITLTEVHDSIGQCLRNWRAG